MIFSLSFNQFRNFNFQSFSTKNQNCTKEEGEGKTFETLKILDNKQPYFIILSLVIIL